MAQAKGKPQSKSQQPQQRPVQRINESKSSERLSNGGTINRSAGPSGNPKK